MPRRLLRKLTDVTTGEQLAAIQETLQAHQIPIEFQIWMPRKKADYEVYRVYVYLGHLQKAKEILKNRE